MAASLPADIDERRAEDIRTEFRKLLERYPPSLARVIKLDPTLMSNPTYLAPYPGLAAFLVRHPEAARYPSYFLNFVDSSDYDWQARQDPNLEIRRSTLNMWRDTMTGTLVLTGFIAAFITLGRIIRYFVNHRRWLRATKIQSDVNNRLLERFTSNEEVMAYIQSPAGSQFLKGAPVVTETMAAADLAAPFGRILWSVQAGLVLTAAGDRTARHPQLPDRAGRGGRDDFGVGRPRDFRRGWLCPGGWGILCPVPSTRLAGPEDTGAARRFERRVSADPERPMSLRDITINDADAALATPLELDVPLQMDEEAFRGFYDRTSRMLWAYIERLTGDRNSADDLLQESYYRFLRSTTTFESESHRRHYLFRIATNLARDGFRRRQAQPVHVPHEDAEIPSALTERTDTTLNQRLDLSSAFAELKHRERAMLWLAYSQGASHREIAESVGVAVGSVKPLLFRARKKLATLLGRKGSAR